MSRHKRRRNPRDGVERSRGTDLSRHTALPPGPASLTPQDWMVAHRREILIAQLPAILREVCLIVLAMGTLGLVALLALKGEWAGMATLIGTAAAIARMLPFRD